jgi:hypothetical protein
MNPQRARPATPIPPDALPEEEPRSSQTQGTPEKESIDPYRLFSREPNSKAGCVPDRVKSGEMGLRLGIGLNDGPIVIPQVERRLDLEGVGKVIYRQIKGRHRLRDSLVDESGSDRR